MTTAATLVVRFEVRPRPGAGDPRGDDLVRRAADVGVALSGARSARVYLIEGDLTDAQIETVRTRLLTDPVVEVSEVGAAEPEPDEATVEVHPLPGVMDPAAQSVRDAILALIGAEVRVSTGWRYDLAGVSGEQAEALARRLVANPVVNAIHAEPYRPEALPSGTPAEFRVTRVPIRDLDDAGLEKLSREGHLFLDLAEMRAIRDHYAAQGREPTDIELETLAQTWSEHCVHKTLKSTISYTGPIEGDAIDWSARPGHEKSGATEVTVRNLLKSTVAAATHELIAEGIDWTLSVFVDNAGIIRFDDQTAVCVKVETHNHPSALEPYGGAATGIGGCIRDIIGTGLAARPIASTDVFCVAHPDTDDIPAGCIPPKRVLTEVVAGVRDYGNRMGIPTVNGAVLFDNRYIGNPLVFCGCVGVMPANLIEGWAKPGDLIVALGGRTGRDGIHGATFSSAELTDTHADEFAHAVQIGNAIEEKRVLDAILRARDESGGPLFSAITDCGAGGFSSAVGEMGEKLGARVTLDSAPLKYGGLTYTEIWISEAQERMVLAVPAENLDHLREICDEEHVELAVLGEFGTPDRELVLTFRGEEVGRLPMEFLHEGLPTPTRSASWSPAPTPKPNAKSSPEANCALLQLLAHPDIASKHFIIRQYDHDVQGNTVVKPLMGARAIGPADSSVIEPNPGTGRGLAIGCGVQTGVGDPKIGGDPYQMALGAIDECVRNLVCVGADPDRIAILDNFCWPSCKKPENLGSLVRAAEGCYDGAKAYRTPFVSGKDSLNNQFTTEDGRTIEIPPTLLITGIGVVPDLEHCVTSDAKRPGNTLIVVGQGETPPAAMGGSRYQSLFGLTDRDDASPPRVDLEAGPKTARAVAALIRAGLVESAHDISDGGLIVAVAELLIGGYKPAAPLGAELSLPGHDAAPLSAAFGESPSRYLLEVSAGRLPEIEKLLGSTPWVHIGAIDESGRLGWAEAGLDLDVEELTHAWRGTLNW